MSESDSASSASAATTVVAEGGNKGGTDEKLPAVVALISSAFYGLGFLVWTAYLASKGISDQTLFSARYVLAGGLVVVISFAYYFFVWRKMAKRALDGIRLPPNTTKFGRIFYDLYFVVEDISGCCLVSAWLAGILIPSIDATPAQVASIVAVGFDRLLFRRGRILKWPRLIFALSFVIQCACNSFFIVYGAFNTPLLFLFSILMTITIICATILTSDTWKSPIDRNYSIFYIAFTIIVGVVTFSATVFGHISAKYGGGEPTKAVVVLSADTDQQIRQAFNKAGKDIFVLLDTGNVTTFQLGTAVDQTSLVQIDHKFIRATFIEPPRVKPPFSVDLGAGKISFSSIFRSAS